MAFHHLDHTSHAIAGSPSAFRWPMPVVIETLIQHGVQNLGWANERGLHGELSGSDGDMTLGAAKLRYEVQIRTTVLGLVSKNLVMRRNRFCHGSARSMYRVIVQHA